MEPMGLFVCARCTVLWVCGPYAALLQRLASSGQAQIMNSARMHGFTHAGAIYNIIYLLPTWFGRELARPALSMRMSLRSGRSQHLALAPGI